MICVFVIMLSGWCRMRMRPARLGHMLFCTLLMFLVLVIFSNGKISRTTIWLSTMQSFASNLQTFP